MTLKKWILTLSVYASTTAFALSQQEILNLINHPNTPSVNHAHHINDQATLAWKNLHGPRTGGAMHVVALKNNPSTLLAFHPYGSGSVYKSTDGGQHWQAVYAAKNETLTDLVSVDENHLLMTADNHIYTSADQGEHWTLAATKDGVCNNLYVINPKLIFLITNRQYNSPNLYKSTNGGKSWEPAHLGVDDSQWYWSLAGRDNVLIVGAAGIFVSTNEGKLWSQPSAKWNLGMARSIVISSTQDIYVANGRLYRTDSQGKTIDQIQNGISDRVGQIAIDRHDRLYAIENRDHADALYTSTDKGQSWLQLYTYQDIHDMTVLDNDHVILSTNEGLIELDAQQQQLAKLPLSFSEAEPKLVFASDDKHYYALDKDLYSSDDAGTTWSISRQAHIVSATVFNDKLVELEWDKNRNDQHILTSDDHGFTWKNVYDNIYQVNHSSCHALVAQNGALIVSCEKNALITHDLVNWNVMDNADDSSHNPYYFDGKFIYYSNGDLIKRSADEGKTWSVLLNHLHGYSTHLSGYQDTVLITTYGAGIIKITNDGKDWDLINTGITDFHFSDITAIDALHYVTSTDDGIFYTNDGGKHWTDENMGLDNLDISSIFANKDMILAGTKGSGVYFSSLNK